MEKKSQKSSPPGGRKGRISTIVPYLICLILGALAVFLYFRYIDQDTGLTPTHLDSPAKPDQSADTGPAKTGTPSTPEPGQASPANQQSASQNANPDDSQTGTTGDPAVDAAAGSTVPAGATSAAGQVGDCKQIIEQINAFYDHLDQQPYMEQFKLDAPSEIYFAKLIQRLIDNPPVVTRETDDLFTVLKNTAHFFRIIGKNNIQLLKGILDQEKNSFEEMLADFYTLTSQPSCLEEAYAIKLSQSALDDYAGFFLNTMGGRLYLFRRDSVSRMVVNYYAILIIEQANTRGSNSRGIEIKAAVDSLIGEIENSGSQLKLKENYLDKLYEIKEKYLQ